MSTANNTQVGGEHYKQHGGTGQEQHWDRAARLGLDYFQSAATKYIERCWDKNGIQDLEKAVHYLQKYIELSREAGRMGAEERKRADLEEQLVEARHQRDFLAQHIATADGVFMFPDGTTIDCAAVRDLKIRYSGARAAGFTQGGMAGDDYSDIIAERRDDFVVQNDGKDFHVEHTKNVAIPRIVDGDWMKRHRSSAHYSCEGFKEGQVLYRCNKPDCRAHFWISMEGTPDEVHLVHDNVTGDQPELTPAGASSLDDEAGAGYVNQARDERVASMEDTTA
jgi:hypothetical protein